MSDTDDLTPGQQKRVDKLVKLAEAEFGWNGLTEPERKLLRCAAIGVEANFTADTPNYKDKLDKAIAAEDEAIKATKPLPPASDRPVPEVKLSAVVVRWLVSDPDATECIDPTGVHVEAATIEDRLDLEFCLVPRPLKFVSCVVRHGMSLLQSNCAFIALHQTLLGNTAGDALLADRVKIAGGAFLRSGFRAEGKVRLVGAEIGGTLECDGGRFVNAGGHALATDGVRVTGSVYLRHGFCAEGKVRLHGAEIGGSLDSEGGRFVNAGGHAFSADRARVAGGVFLRHGFRAEGEVRLPGAEIGGNLECDGGRFLNAKRCAFRTDGVDVAGSVFLRDGFRADGEVILSSASIGIDLDCGGGRYVNAAGVALSATSIKVAGNVFMRGEFRADGMVLLFGAKIGGNLECQGGRFLTARGDALSVRAGAIKGVCILRAHENSAGTIDFRQCEIGTLDDAPSGNSRQGFKWPEKILLSGCNYDAIEAGSPMDARNRLKWLDSQDNTAGADVPNPQPYRHLADVLKKQGHEKDARTILRVCANRRILPLAARARGLGPIDPLFYLSVIGLIGIALCGLLVAANHLVASAWVLGVLNVGVVVCLVAGSMNKLRALTGLIEWARVFGTQWSYRLVVGHGYARWRAVAWAFAFFMSGATVFNQNSEQTMQPAQAVALRAFTDIDRKPVEN